MTYTSIDQVAQMFPSFTRASAKGPSDALIQTFVADVAAEINATLQRRFQEAIGETAQGDFEAWVTAFSDDQTNLLEKMNRFGACGEMASVFQSLGLGNMEKLATDYGARFKAMFQKLNARDDSGRPVEQGGEYDYLFDAQAKVETPRAQMRGIAGGEMPDTETTKDEDLSNYVGKFDPQDE